MATPKRRKRSEDRELASRLSSRVAELEDRLSILEARVRKVSAQADALIQLAAQRMPKVKLARERPRCPGCRLELPKGRRGTSCVWCGFVFDAVPVAKH